MALFLPCFAANSWLLTLMSTHLIFFFTSCYFEVSKYRAP